MREILYKPITFDEKFFFAKNAKGTHLYIRWAFFWGHRAYIGKSIFRWYEVDTVRQQFGFVFCWSAPLGRASRDFVAGWCLVFKASKSC